MQNKSDNNVLIIATLVSLLLLAIVSIKYLRLHQRWEAYVLSAQQRVMDYPNRDAEEDAIVFSSTITTVSLSVPLYKQDRALQNYVNLISNKTNRDIVVTDEKKQILADTISGNIGKRYTQDGEQEVGKTIMDGQTRHFTEKSVDYPKGIWETVVPMRDGNNKIIGSVIMSASQIFRK